MEYVVKINTGGYLMFFKKIDNLNNALDVKKLYENSFPEEERTDFFKLFSDIYEEFQLYALYDNKNLIAFIHFKCQI